MHQDEEAIEQLDVVVVGAGLSGIGVGCYLRHELPSKSFVILESRGASGGTWDLFRYPGIRSDSDLQTYGYDFKPWLGKDSIASGAEILAYIREAAAENDLDRRIRYHHRVTGASWSTQTGRWLVDVERVDTGARVRLSAKWLFSAGGYFRYDQGFTPQIPGVERFAGTIVHPQHWPEGETFSGRNVVVIGSGATAVTLVPALARAGANVTMLQRTPSYILPIPRRDPIANALVKMLGARGYDLARRKNIGQQRLLYGFCRKYPKAARLLIRRLNAVLLPRGFPVDMHFKPPYEPWDQRLCIVPDADFFRVIRKGQARVVTDRIETFTEDGIRLESGDDLPADVVVTATGLNVQAFGGLALKVDDAAVDLQETYSYKGVMLSGVPNFAAALGYTNASWTLKVGLVCEYFTRVLAHMDTHGYDVCRPEVRGAPMRDRPLLDLDAGYVRRAADVLPRQGDRAPWETSMDYLLDVDLLRIQGVEDPELQFSPVGQRSRVGGSAL